MSKNVAIEWENARRSESSFDNLWNASYVNSLFDDFRYVVNFNDSTNMIFHPSLALVIVDTFEITKYSHV